MIADQARAGNISASQATSMNFVLARLEGVTATGPEVHPDGTPSWCMAEYDFAPRGEPEAVEPIDLPMAEYKKAWRKALPA